MQWLIIWAVEKSFSTGEQLQSAKSNFLSAQLTAQPDTPAVAAFGPVECLQQKPSSENNNGQRFQFLDCAGDGTLDFASFDRTAAGFYKLDQQEKWATFKSFKTLPSIEWNDPNLRFVDLTGDGHADIMITENEVITWYESKGEDGFGPSHQVRSLLQKENAPHVIFSDLEQSIYLADMSGDGLSDIVRIKNGSICYWPNKGYGVFGAKIIMDNAPRFDTDDIFNQKRVLLADIDGSGTTDIIYLSSIGAQLYFNLSGNSWSNPYIISQFPSVNSITSVRALDLLGNGTASIVWSSPLPGDAQTAMRYIELMGEGKPHLLTRVVNNMGAETKNNYVPSTKFYQQDKDAGKPWATRLPFPVHVVEQIETIDFISKSRLVTRYAYHHGYFDGTEREFSGFGMVETIDTETFDEYQGNGEHYVAPVLTRTWIHTGAPIHDSVISNVYEKEYWKGDPDAFVMPDTVLPELDASEINEASRALRGTGLRKEIYELGKDVPYQVIESNFTVRRMQPKNDFRHGVFFAHAHETITFHYEQNAADPRIGHEYVLEVDDFGNVIKSASLVYPRRSEIAGLYTEQSRPYITVQSTRFINSTGPFYLIGIPCESQSFEIGGLLTVTSDTRFDFESACSLVDSALLNVIAYQQTFDPIQTQARLISWSKWFFWNESQSTVLALGGITGRALLHHEENTVFTPELIDNVFGSDITDSNLLTAKYRSADGYWWNPGMTQFFQNGTFYLPIRTEDPFGGYVSISYDIYYLSPVSVVDALGNTTAAQIDYRTLQPYKLTDPNGSISEAITDPLGMVIATSVYGSENGVQKGDLPLRGAGGYAEVDDPTIADIIATPAIFLQNATGFFYYDLEAWYKRSETPQFIALARETHVRDLTAGESTRIQISLGYSDGFGRGLQSKIKVENGIAWERQNDNTYIEKQVTDRWLVSGRTVYNNKQMPVKQYEPFYSAAYQYEPEEFFATYGVTPVIHYDPLLRVVRTDTPKGFFSKVEFTPWEVRTFDENDTVKDSDYYQQNMPTDPSSFIPNSTFQTPDYEALLRAESHYNTPSIQHLDTLGRAFITVENKLDIGLLNGSNRVANELITYTEFNITGQPLTVTDPRQYDSALGVKNFQYTYAMDGTVLRTVSVDAGDDRMLVNVMGKPVISFDATGHRITVEYDLLHRPVFTRVTGNGLDNTTERLIYGESQLNPALNNLRGKLYKHYDQAGMITVPLYSFKGEPKRSEQRIRTEYKTEANWAVGGNTYRSTGSGASCAEQSSSVELRPVQAKPFYPYK